MNVIVSVSVMRILRVYCIRLCLVGEVCCMMVSVIVMILIVLVRMSMVGEVERNVSDLVRVMDIMVSGGLIDCVCYLIMNVISVIMVMNLSMF